MADLNRDFFDSNEPRKLYYYYADLNGISIEETSIPKIKEVYSLMLDLANKKGVGFC